MERIRKFVTGILVIVILSCFGSMALPVHSVVAKTQQYQEKVNGLSFDGQMIPKSGKSSTYHLNLTNVCVEQGNTCRLFAYVVTNGAIRRAKNVKWSSSNKKAVTVDQKGKVKAVFAGKATITAKAAGKKLVCKVKAVKPGKIAEQFYGVWKDKKGNKYELYPGGLDTALKRILKYTGGNNYQFAGITSYIKLSDRMMIHFKAKKGKKNNSVFLVKTSQKTKMLKTAFEEGAFPDVMEMKAGKISFTRVKDMAASKIIFLGDSRFVGMSLYEHDKQDVYIAKESQGLKWFMEQEAAARRYDSPSTVFVIGFGVNDLYHVKQYADYVNGLKLRGVVYFCTVNPVDEALERRYGYTVTNRQIQDFNKVLKDNARDYKVLDTYSGLIKTGFRTMDGVHYQNETYSKLYRYIKLNAALW